MLPLRNTCNSGSNPDCVAVSATTGPDSPGISSLIDQAQEESQSQAIEFITLQPGLMQAKNGGSPNELRGRLESGLFTDGGIS